jgi:hypothetical protein
MLTDSERLNLQKMLSESDCEDNTSHIRKVKHSVHLRDDIRKLDTFKQNNVAMRDSDSPRYLGLAQSECSFLYNNYTDIFNRIMKDELDLEIMTKLLIVLKLIEDGKVDQHEGSVMVGKILKELYVDSAIKLADHLDANNPVQPEAVRESKSITWKDYKHLQGA